MGTSCGICGELFDELDGEKWGEMFVCPGCYEWLQEQEEEDGTGEPK